MRSSKKMRQFEGAGVEIMLGGTNRLSLTEASHGR